MNNTNKLTLIEGSFSQEEAREILLNMFSAKINFHNARNWSSQERWGKDDAIAQQRVPALKQEVEKLEAILAEAGKGNKELLIQSEVSITIR
ncbi:MAG: hypothetical protein JNK08_10675 [Sediminibacterium sp.]|nr:hypothetical protein [Sediminibacterium sp.]